MQNPRLLFSWRKAAAISYDLSLSILLLFFLLWKNVFFSVHLCTTDGNIDHQEPLCLSKSSRRFCIFSVKFSSDGRELLGGANDGCLYIYDLHRQEKTNKVIIILKNFWSNSRWLYLNEIEYNIVRLFLFKLSWVRFLFQLPHT